MSVVTVVAVEDVAFAFATGAFDLVAVVSNESEIVGEVDVLVVVVVVVVDVIVVVVVVVMVVDELVSASSASVLERFK